MYSLCGEITAHCRRTMYLLVPELVVLLYKFAPSSALPPCAEVKILLLWLFDHFHFSLFDHFFRSRCRVRNAAATSRRSCLRTSWRPRRSASPSARPTPPSLWSGAPSQPGTPGWCWASAPSTRNPSPTTSLTANYWQALLMSLAAQLITLPRTPAMASGFCSVFCCDL